MIYWHNEIKQFFYINIYMYEYIHIYEYIRLIWFLHDIHNWRNDCRDCLRIITFTM